MLRLDKLPPHCLHAPNSPQQTHALTDDGWLEVDKDGPGYVLAGSGLVEEGVEGVVAGAEGLVGGHGAVGRDTVLEAVQLPTGVAHLAAGLAHVDRDALTLREEHRS